MVNYTIGIFPTSRPVRGTRALGRPRASQALLHTRTHARGPPRTVVSMYAEVSIYKDFPGQNPTSTRKEK